MNAQKNNWLDQAIKKIQKLVQNKSVTGLVEKIHPAYIEGWSIDTQDSEIKIKIKVDKQVYALEPVWIERSDVAHKYGNRYLYSGFRCPLLQEQSDSIFSALKAERTVGIFANGQLLGLSASKIQDALKPGARAVKPEPEPAGEVLSARLDQDLPQLSSERINIEVKMDGLSLMIESVGQFTLKGWCHTNGNTLPVLGITCGENVIECNVIYSASPMPAEVGNAVEARRRFEIELPGYLWEPIENEGAAALTLLIDGQKAAHEPIEINRKQAALWVTEITEMQEGPVKQTLNLRALEHIRYGDLLSEVPESVSQYAQDFAERMQLGEFLRGGKKKAATATDLQVQEQNRTESLSTLLLWQALRELNRRIPEGNGLVFDQVLSVLKKQKLKDDAREQFIYSVSPLLCKSGEFLRVKELIDIKTLQQLGNRENLWEKTLSIPAIIVSGNVGRATDVLYCAASGLDKGWLNTECISFSLQQVQRMEVEGEIELATGERFRYAIINLLDAFKGEWFSRLHDLCLIDSMLHLLADIERYTDYHRKDVVAAAQRIYGLNPAFWERATQRKLAGLDRELARSHEHFRKLHAAFEKGCTNPSEWLEEIAEPLAYYRAKKNPEAVIFLREVCANLLPAFNDSLTTRAKALLARLMTADPAEALRIAAFPLATENRLIEVFPETEPEMMRETLRSLSDPAKSVAWHLQENASEALKNLLGAAESDKQLVGASLEKLEERAIALANWEGGFLAFDMLASAYSIAKAQNLNCAPLLSRMSSVLKRAMEETKADWYLPPPILAGLARLSAIHGPDPLLKGFLIEYRGKILGKFGDRMEDLFIRAEAPKMPLAGNGWPQDTLVVIYSCRKYLATRIEAIRHTWVQDLKARNIPYLVLVGDGDDTVTDDVLALDVSDTYEDLPKKSLKLFDWVYRNTDAQYVLKIDDDCFLDVARFFDTLSYRKHFYYGRVLRRGIGSMDRAWHQSKSQSMHSRKSIDKSPEPSVYADGGGGYTLSRMAMQQLLKAAQSPQGERLKACSFMEDKLVGDLLAMYYIEPSDEDYDSYQRRRTFGEAMPVGMWENTFFPSLATPTKMTHLDTDKDQQEVHERMNSSELWPKKLWPTCWTPQVGLNKNQLELLTGVQQAAALLENKLMVVSVVRNEMTLLPHFLAHYRALGVKCFAFVDNCSDDGTREYLYVQPDVILYSSDTEYKHSHYGVAWQQAVLGNLCMGKWALLADADELMVFENSETRPLADYVADIEAEGCNAACTIMVDMYPAGDLHEADFDKSNPFEVAAWFDNPVVETWRLGSGWFSNSTSNNSHLRHRVVPNSVPHDFVSQKYALFRYNPWIRLSQGVHYASNLKVSKRPSWFAHFKYHAGFKAKVELEIKRGQHFNNAAEYRRYADMLAESRGGFGVEGVSLRFESSSSFANNNEKL